MVPHDPAEPLPDSTPAAARLPWTRGEIALLAVVLLVAALSRWSRLPAMSEEFAGIAAMPRSAFQSDPPSMDETWHLALSTGRGSPISVYPRDTLLRDVPAWTSLADAPPWWKIWNSLDGVAHPPLYLITLRWWRAVIGEGDLPAIAYSIVWSLAAIVFVYLAARETMTRAVAFWAAAALAIGPAPLYFALEIRGYSMLVALSALAIYIVSRMQRRGVTTANTAGLCLTLLACMLVHYFSAPAALGLGIYAAALAGRRYRQVLVAGLVTAAVYAAIWTPQLARQLRSPQIDSNYLHRDTSALGSVLAAVSLPLRLIAEVPIGDQRFAIPGAVLLVAAVVGAVRRPELRPMLVWGLSIGAYLLVSDLARSTKQLNFIRYAAAALPLAATITPGAAASLSRHGWPTHVAGFAIVVVALFNYPGVIRAEVTTLTPVVQPVLPFVRPGETIAFYMDFANPEPEPTTDAMLLEWARMPGVFPRDAIILYKPMSPQVRRQLRTKYLWLLALTPADPPMAVVPNSRFVRRERFWATSSQYASDHDRAGRVIGSGSAGWAWLLELDDLPATTPSTRADDRDR